MRPLPRIEVMDVLRETNEALVDLLRSLSDADWMKPTVHRDRTVKDLASHLLDGSLRRLAMQRDGFFGEAFTGSSYAELVAFIQRLNREWIVATRRLSPKMLVGMIADADAEVFDLFASIAPDAKAAFGVAWAGEETSAHWFDVAREYTEKWHHQQQIRDAVGRPGLAGRRHLHPVIDTFLRGAPHAYRDTAAADGTGVRIEITGEAGGGWHLQHEGGRWELTGSPGEPPATTVTIDADTAWRLWTKGIDRRTARERATIEGDPALAEPLLGMVTVMA